MNFLAFQLAQLVFLIMFLKRVYHFSGYDKNLKAIFRNREINKTARIQYHTIMHNFTGMRKLLFENWVGECSIIKSKIHLPHTIVSQKGECESVDPF